MWPRILLLLNFISKKISWSMIKVQKNVKKRELEFRRILLLMPFDNLLVWGHFSKLSLVGPLKLTELGFWGLRSTSENRVEIRLYCKQKLLLITCCHQYFFDRSKIRELFQPHKPFLLEHTRLVQKSFYT